MTLHVGLEPMDDLELYLAYARPAGLYAGFADILKRLRSMVPSFDFDRALTNPDARVVSVREGECVRGLAVLGCGGAKPVFQLYYADDPQSTRLLMTYVEGVIHAQPAHD